MCDEVTILLAQSGGLCSRITLLFMWLARLSLVKPFLWSFQDRSIQRLGVEKSFLEGSDTSPISAHHQTIRSLHHEVDDI